MVVHPVHLAFLEPRETRVPRAVQDGKETTDHREGPDFLV